MSHYDYELSKQITAQSYPFYSIVMAAIRQADTSNAMRLKVAFPGYQELQERYNSPGGLINGERFLRE